MAVNTDADVIDVQSEGELDVVVESEELVASSRRPAPIEHKSSLIPHGKDELEMKVELEVKGKKKVRRGSSQSSVLLVQSGNGGFGTKYPISRYNNNLNSFCCYLP